MTCEKVVEGLKHSRSSFVVDVGAFWVGYYSEGGEDANVFCVIGR